MKKKIFSLILGIGVMLNYSCKKDLLAPAHPTQVSTIDLNQFTTVARIQAQVLGLYANLRSGAFYGGRYQVYQEIRAENWINQSTNGVTNTATWNQSVTAGTSEVENLWSQIYRTINYCNLFIDGMAAKGNTVVTATQAANYVAEAKCIRAICYYSLLQMYARPFSDGAGSKPGVPLRLTGNAVSGNYALARSTVAQVYAQIVQDLNDAETGLPLTYADATTITTRLHRNTAIAFKTRVFLAMQRYADVITEANKIVSATAPYRATTGVANALVADVTTIFAAPYTSVESMFSMPFITTETPGTQNQLGFYFYNNGSVRSAEFYLNPQGVVSDANWKATDRRRTFVETSTASPTTGNQYLAKYKIPNPWTDWAPVVRYAEVILNLAEARARITALDPQAIALVNAIRSRSDATTILAPTTGQALIDAILQERNIELLGEGFRTSDLLRLGLTLPAKTGAPAIAPTDSRYVWPIPNSELLYNNLISPTN